MEILRKIFSSYESEIWQQLSDQLGGEFIKEDTHKQKKLILKADQWPITVDIHCEPGYKSEKLYTRLRAPFVNADDFKFTLCHETIFDHIVKLLGIKDVSTGFDELDKMFFLKTNNPEKLKALFAGSILRELTKTEPDIHVQVRDSGNWFQDDFPDGVDELILEVEGEVKDLQRLKILYVLFAQFLHSLCRIGSAYENDPKINP